MTRWGMVIDLRQCIGCQACAAICAQTNHVPLDAWRRVPDVGIGRSGDRQRTFLPMSCMQCGNAPCLEVCPTTATFRREDGIVDIDYNLCIGCGYCVVACPYLARTIMFHDGVADRYDNELAGICTKCNFCAPRIETGLERGYQPGIDREATPMCVVTCTANALHFGDLDDMQSNVSRLIRQNKTAHLQEALGTDPVVTYIVE